MIEDALEGGPTKATFILRELDPVTREEVGRQIVEGGWQEPDGTPITDPERIAELEAGVAARKETG